MTEEEFNNLPQGWSSKDSVDALELLAQNKYNTVLELGSFVGRSSVILAKYSGHVHCVDTWNARYVAESSIKKVGIDHKDQIYETFLDNVAPYPNISLEKTNFIDLFVTHSMMHELTFIDAGPHSTIMEDLLEFAWEHSSRCIAGYHYYGDFRNITDCVDRFASKHKLQVKVDRCLWSITKE